MHPFARFHVFARGEFSRFLLLLILSFHTALLVSLLWVVLENQEASALSLRTIEVLTHGTAAGRLTP